MAAKTSFVTLRKNAADMIFFHQKMRNWYWGNYKKEGEKSVPV